MQSKRVFIGFLWALTTVFMLGCASTPYEGEGKTKSDALLKQQFDNAAHLRAVKPEGRIIFAGFAMHSQSKVFRRDVVTAEKLMRSIDPNAIVFKLDNPAWGQSADWPYATSENMGLVLKKVAEFVRPEDKVVILMSTHGNVNFLSINFDDRSYPGIDSKWIKQTLAGLRGKPTLLLLSACYSGSFIEPLGGPSRIIMTAAAKDKSSFGCAFHDSNTYFIDALLNQPNALDRTLVQLM